MDSFMDILNKTMLNQVRENNTFKRLWQTSLVIQWMKIHPLRKGTQVWFLVWKDSTCRRTTTPLYHNYWAFAPQLLKPAHPRSYTLQETTAWKAHKPQWWVAPLATVRESPCTVTKTQCSQQLKKKKKVGWRGSCHRHMQVADGTTLKQPSGCFF